MIIWNQQVEKMTQNDYNVTCKLFNQKLYYSEHCKLFNQKINNWETYELFN